VEIRELKRIEEYEACLVIQREAWQFEDIDLVPVPLFVLARDYGGVILGSFIEDKLVGFVYALPVLHDKELVLHSHMLAVLPQYQNRGIGYRLKLAQREEARRRGYHLITWTYDFLQRKNSYLNFRKLGGIARRLYRDYYGQSSSLLHSGLPTDRLLVEWHLDQPRTRTVSEFTPILEYRDGEFIRKESSGAIGIEIPSDIQRLKQEDLNLAHQWQHEVRSALETYFQKGYQVVDFSNPFLVLVHD